MVDLRPEWLKYIQPPSMSGRWMVVLPNLTHFLRFTSPSFCSEIDPNPIWLNSICDPSWICIPARWRIQTYTFTQITTLAGGFNPSEKYESVGITIHNRKHVPNHQLIGFPKNAMDFMENCQMPWISQQNSSIFMVKNLQQIRHGCPCYPWAKGHALCIRMKFRSLRNSLEEVSDMFRSLGNPGAIPKNCHRKTTGNP